MKTIQSVFKEFRVPYQEAGHRHVRRGWVGVDCPHCSPGSEKFRLGFEISTGRTSCWVCGLFYGPKILSRLLRISEQDSNKIWRDIGRREFRSVIDKDVKRGRIENPPGLADLSGAHSNYLIRRGFDPDQLTMLWKIKGIGLASKLKWRIWIPIYDRFGSEQVSWTTRAIDPADTRRYLSAKPEQEVTSHKEILYGSWHAQHVIIISEGPFDAWSWGPGGVATLGLSYTRSQLNEMVRYPVRAVCFDSEPAAQKRAHGLAEVLSSFPGRTELIQLESGKDANECLVNCPEELDEVRRFLGIE